MYPESEIFKSLPNDIFEYELKDQSPSFSKTNGDKNQSLLNATTFLTMNTKSLSTSLVPVQKKTEKELKNKLADSLSPSPFRREDESKRDAKLEQVVASVPCTTKTLLSSPFYVAELMGYNGHRAWNEYILKMNVEMEDSTLEALSIIKRLCSVSEKIIERRCLSMTQKVS
jgi:hypothetical protein